MQVASAAPLSEGQGSRGWEMWVQGGDEGEKALPVGGGQATEPMTSLEGGRHRSYTEYLLTKPYGAGTG